VGKSQVAEDKAERMIEFFCQVYCVLSVRLCLVKHPELGQRTRQVGTGQDRGKERQAEAIANAITL
jgi:hypothetical protein